MVESVRPYVAFDMRITVLVGHVIAALIPWHTTNGGLEELDGLEEAGLEEAGGGLEEAGLGEADGGLEEAGGLESEGVVEEVKALAVGVAPHLKKGEPSEPVTRSVATALTAGVANLALTNLKNWFDRPLT